MKIQITNLILILIIIGSASGYSQSASLKIDSTLIVPELQFDARDKDRPVWGQAFTTDKGKTWEWNFYNISECVN